MAKRKRATKPLSASNKQTTRRRSSSQKRRTGTRNFQISPEKKKDILGIFFILLGFIFLMSMLGFVPSGLTQDITRLLARIAGRGSILFPVVLLLVGMWYILRNEQRFPIPSIERLLGVVFLYLNLLAWLHWFSGGGWELAALGDGGGYLGALFERILYITLGEWGTLVVLIAWLLIALAFTFDLSIPDLIRNLTRPAAKTGAFIAEKSSQLVEKSKKSEPVRKADHVFDEKSRSPVHLEGFYPIKKRGRILEKPQQGSLAGKVQAPIGQAGQPPVAEKEIARVFRSSQNSVKWVLPDLEKILNPASPLMVKKSFDQDRAKVIEETLNSFSAPAHVVEIHRGPTFTQYGVEPDFLQTRNGKMRVRVSKISSLADDLALALAAPSIRIQAPVPGRRYIGIEVPNQEVELVSLLEGMRHKSFQSSKAFLKFILGKDVSGNPVFVNLASLPHLLIAGTTGAGKSVCLHAIIRCLLLQRTPNEMRLVLVDPKRVEMTNYNDIPHLLTPVVVEPEKVVGTLQWMSREMDSRYTKFSEIGARNIDDYNLKQTEKLPYILVVIDELADLMMLAPEETERNLNRLAQLARATGIHVIIATQRPSTDVITGMIKANFPARIALNVASNVDSRVILDQPGAERLLGRGDMLYQATDAPSPVRLQGVYVSDEEFNRLVRFWVEQTRQLIKDNPQSSEMMPQKIYPSATQSPVPTFDVVPGSDEDELLGKAIEIVRQEERASISMLQRKLRIGYTRAARLVDRLEEMEIISKSEPGGGYRTVLDFGEEKDEN